MNQNITNAFLSSFCVLGLQVLYERYSTKFFRNVVSLLWLLWARLRLPPFYGLDEHLLSGSVILERLKWTFSVECDNTGG